jgi:hypothetical protein
MIKVSLTDLVDIVSRSGTPKATRVAQVKRRPEYEPAFDFYKPLRDHIVSVHIDGGDKGDIGKVMREIVDGKKLRNYPPLIDGYVKWWGRKTFAWLDPPRVSYEANGVEVIINPELGLEFGGARHVIKLYFKADPLSKTRADIIVHLMELSLRPICGQEERMSVLDVRNARLIAYNGAVLVKPMIDAELAYIASLWSSV